MKLPAVLFSGLLAIAGVKAQFQGEPILQLSAIGPPGSGINGPLYNTTRGVGVRSSSEPHHNDDQVVLIRPERLPMTPYRQTLHGVNALLHLWTEHGDPHPNRDLATVLAIGGHRSLRLLSLQNMRADAIHNFGGAYDWWAFVLSDAPPAHDDKSQGPQPPPVAANALTYNEPGRWVALQQSDMSHVLAWYDGWSQINGIFYNVDIVYSIWKGPGHGQD